MARTPVHVVTGFLGSGKTTLVNRLLADPEMADTAVVVNEFGEIGLDHDLIAASDDAIVLLANGCLCCAVKGELVRTLDELHRRRDGGSLPPFARVVVETSGLADPGPVVHALAAEPTLRARYLAGGVVTVVDAINGAATLDAHAEAVAQVALADRILISKLDLPAADPARRSGLEARLRALAPAADLLDARDAPDAATLLGGDAFDVRSPAPDVERWLKVDRIGPAAAAAVRAGHRDDVRAFVIVRDEPVPEAALRLFLSALGEASGPALLRMKGIVAIAEEPALPAVVHGVQGLVQDVERLPRWPSGDHRTRLVFITAGGGREPYDELFDTALRMSSGAARARAGAGRGEPGNRACQR